MFDSVTVEAAARLHLGFLDMNGGLGRRFGGLGLAIESLLRPATRYVVVGGPDDPQSRSLEEAARRVFDPGKQVVRLDPEKDKQELSRLKLPALKEAFVTVCREGVCSEPARDEAALKQRVARATRAGSEGAEGPQR